MSDALTLSAALRADLNAFIEKVFHTVSARDAYKHNWHIEAVAHQLQRCLDGENRRLIVTQPPRSLKSICTSVAFVAWALGHNPSLRFACVSYSNDLALFFSRQFRTVVTSEWYRELFPQMRIKRETDIECVTTKGGGRVATSIGSTFTGRGADIIIIDDPMKGDEAQSEKARAAVSDWYSSTLLSRLNDKEKGVIILVMQRLHEDDLAGKLLAEGDWHHLDLPAIAVEDQSVPIGPDETYDREAGEALHPERESLETLERLKTRLGSLTFSAQYQQRPVPIEGNLIKREWFKHYETPPERTTGTRIVQSWDIATTVGSTNDYSVCTTWMMVKNDYYLIDVWRGRKLYPDLRKMLITLAHRHGPNTIIIEEAGPGIQLLQDLKSDAPPGVPRPVGVKPKGDKRNRMEACSSRFEAGQVHLPKDAPWLHELLHELLAFPSSRHDDQVDSVSLFLNWAQRRKHYTVRIGRAPELIWGDPNYYDWNDRWH